MKNTLVKRLLIILPAVLMFLGVHMLVSHFRITSLFLIFLLYFGVLVIYIIGLKLATSSPVKKFELEMGKIVREFNNTKDAKTFYDKLMVMKAKAPSPVQNCTVALNISTALFYQGRYEESLDYLDGIQTTDERIMKIVAQQKKDIKNKMEQ